MNRRLPPFSAVRAFEAAARHMNFSKAADEILVSQSAVSHQVRALEEYLGTQLFERLPGGVALTAAGEDYRDDLRLLLDGLDACTRKIRDTERAGRLSIRTTPGLASRWLIPRLASFRTACPEIELDLSTAMPPTEFSRGDVDVFLHWGGDPVPGVVIEPFLSARKSLVCRPEIARRLSGPQDILGETLVRDRHGDQWEQWFTLAGLSGPVPADGPTMDHCELVLNAVEGGLGVSLSYDALTQQSLADGRLVEPFDLRTEPVLIYSLAWQKNRSSNPRIKAFRRWILAEVEAESRPLAAAE